MSHSLDYLSLVVPVYNEREVLPLLVPRLQQVLARLSCRAEVIFVDDGSRDGSREMLRQIAAEHAWVRVVEFARNFGHQAAITAGIDLARGDAVVVMDADLQDPPELILELVEQYEHGFDVVNAQRIERLGETWFKRATASAFYKLMRACIHRELPDNVADFRLMSRPVVEALSQLREQHRFLRGMVTWLGFRQTSVPFSRGPRAAGTTKYPLRKMLAFAWRAITAFSALPLRMAFYGAGVLLLGGLALATYGVSTKLFAGEWLSAWAWLFAAQAIFCGFTLLTLGLIGDYIARIYDEVKGRPLYIVDQLINVSADAVPRRAILPLSIEGAAVPRPHLRLDEAAASTRATGV